MFASIRRIPVKHPFAFGVVFAGIKHCTADILVQKTVENKEEVDIRRATVFTAFGALFCGAWQYGLFVKLMPWLCPNAVSFAGKSIRAKLKDVPGMKQLAIQVFIENGINNPILYYPTFYSIKAFIEGHSAVESIPVGINKYRENLVEDVIAIWKVWVPAQFFNFAFSPMWFRVPFVACVSFMFTCYVSFKRGAPDDENEVECVSE